MDYAHNRSLYKMSNDSSLYTTYLLCDTVFALDNPSCTVTNEQVQALGLDLDGVKGLGFRRASA